MVSVLAFFSVNHSSNPATVFSVKFVFEKHENKKEAGVGPFEKGKEGNDVTDSTVNYDK